MVSGSTPRRPARSDPYSDMHSLQETPKSHLSSRRLRPRDPVTGRFISFVEAERRRRDKKDATPEDSPKEEVNQYSVSPDPIPDCSPSKDKEDNKPVERDTRAQSTPKSSRIRPNLRGRRGC